MAEFELVEWKLAEVGFFAEKLHESQGDPFEAECYLSAFVSASRSVTNALQAALTAAPGFRDWYRDEAMRMRSDPEARWFVAHRNASIHEGSTGISGGSGFKSDDGTFHARYVTDPNDGGDGVLATDLLPACLRHHEALVELVLRAKARFAEWADADWLFHESNLRSRGMTVEDLEETLGLPRGWTVGMPTEARLRILRRSG